MGLFVPSKKVGIRHFSYEPRFYNPEKEDQLRRRMRIMSKVRRRRNPLGLVIFSILFIMVLYIYMTLM
ncbi:MAG: hypothetical protein IIA50_03180 [Bacteroidetes bacterium]|nr:hypothetical protein [Bacteroidota bacterium]